MWNSRERRELELDLLLTRSVLVAAGYSAVEGDANFAPARELATEVGDLRTRSLLRKLDYAPAASILSGLAFLTRSTSTRNYVERTTIGQTTMELRSSAP